MTVPYQFGLRVRTSELFGSVPSIPLGLALLVLVKILPDRGCCRLSRALLVWDNVMSFAMGRLVEWEPSSPRQFLFGGAVVVWCGVGLRHLCHDDFKGE